MTTKKCSKCNSYLKTMYEHVNESRADMGLSRGDRKRSWVSIGFYFCHGCKKFYKIREIDVSRS